MEKKKRKRGDRRDAELLRNIDSMHYFMPYLYPNRCDNEAYISERIDLTNCSAFLKKKNERETEFPYTLFHVVLAAIAKTITLRPKMNRFIKRKRNYLRNKVTAAFVVKKGFTDDAEEALAFLEFPGESTITTQHEMLRAEITACRSDVPDNSTASLDLVRKLPRFLLGFVMWIFHRLDECGMIPYSLVKTDPYHSSVMLTNLGSIKLKAGYHHLTNWGTTSLFVVIGEKKMTPVYRPDGSMEMRETVDLGLTVDERIADGYYYSKTVRLFKHLLENPELLELPANESVPYEFK